MAERNLHDAFNDCIDRLALGQPLDAVLSAYPQYADQFGVMLRVAQTARMASAVLPVELDTARERVRLKIIEALAQPYVMPQPRLLPTMRRMLATAAVVLIVGFIGALLLFDRQQPFAVIESLTPPTPTPTLTFTATVTPEPSETATPTETDVPPSATPSQTATTPAPSATAADTQTAAPSATASSSPTRTLAPTLAASATNTPNSEGCIKARPDDWVTFRVRRGDTLPAIAAASRTTTETLIAVNCLLNPSLLGVGTELYLPRVPVFVTPSITATRQIVPTTQPTSAPQNPPAPTSSDDDDNDDDDGGDDDGGGDDD